MADVGDQEVPIVLNLDSDRQWFSPPPALLAGLSSRFDISRGVDGPPGVENEDVGGIEGFAGMVRHFLELHRIVVQARARTP